MAKQSRSILVMQAVLEAVAQRLMTGDEILIRIPEVCEATGVNYGSIYHHFGSREGVIDAAYNMLFTRFAERDLIAFQRVNDSVATLEEYVDLMTPFLTSVASGPDRMESRAMRLRIVSAANTRPNLRSLIGETQARLSSELRRIIEFAQGHEWLRDDIPADTLAVVLQALIFGRSLDDVSDEPIEDEQWVSAMITMFTDILKR